MLDMQLKNAIKSLKYSIQNCCIYIFAVRIRVNPDAKQHIRSRRIRLDLPHYLEGGSMTSVDLPETAKMDLLSKQIWDPDPQDRYRDPFRDPRACLCQ